MEVRKSKNNEKKKSANTSLKYPLIFIYPLWSHHGIFSISQATPCMITHHREDTFFFFFFFFFWKK